MDRLDSPEVLRKIPAMPGIFYPDVVIGQAGKICCKPADNSILFFREAFITLSSYFFQGKRKAFGQ